MRKYALLAVVSMAAALGVAQVAGAINGTQTMSTSLSKSKAGTKKKPRSVGTLKITTATTPAVGESGTFATRTAIIFFDKNLVFGGAKFPSCSLTQVNTDDTKCPAGSRVGSGSSAATFANQAVPLTVRAYNGSKGKQIFLLVDNPQFNIHTALIGTLSKASGLFGSKLTVVIPDNLQAPVPGNFATLTSFVTNVGGVRKGTPYVGLKGCSRRKLNFKGTFNYTDNTSKTATATAKCRK